MKAGNDGQIYATASEGKIYTRDEYNLATLGYKQEFLRSLGLFENWAATFTSMNFVSGIPVLFGWVMYTGGPKAAFANWTMVGGLSSIVSLVLAEVSRGEGRGKAAGTRCHFVCMAKQRQIAAALPTAGGIYYRYWSYRLGGEEWGPFLSWMTGWWPDGSVLFPESSKAQPTSSFLLSK